MCNDFILFNVCLSLFNVISIITFVAVLLQPLTVLRVFDTLASMRRLDITCIIHQSKGDNRGKTNFFKH